MQRKALALSLVLLNSSLVIAAQSSPPQAQSQSTAPAPAISTADKPTRQQLLTLFEVMHLRSQMQDMLKMLPTALEQQLQSEQQEVELNLMPGGPGLTADQKAARDQITKKYFELAEKIYPTDEMLNDMIVVYQRHLTRDDVDGILAFYRSPAGQHLVEAQPVMAREVMPMVMTKMESRSKDLVNRYKKELNDAIGPPKIPPPAAPKS